MSIGEWYAHVAGADHGENHVFKRPPVVGVQIKSGLGNQMFMYAAGLAMAERLGATLYCDITHFGRKPRADRALALPAFGLTLRAAVVPSPEHGRGLGSVLGAIRDPFRDAELLVNKDGYDPRFHQITGSCVLSGYFQSWRYFAGHEASVRQAFDVDRIATANTTAAEAQIVAVQHPVAVHVRRGDYLKAKAVAKFGTLDTSYYDAARAAIEAALAPGRATYFLFSDEPQVAREILSGWKDVRVVSGFSALEDFRLMALCRHFIIANSTFSWWAAWLGRAPDKRVIAPRHWFTPGNPRLAFLDERLPPDWIRV